MRLKDQLQDRIKEGHLLCDLKADVHVYTDKQNGDPP